jgi:cysteine sulfinate desulfinase/cysteine desulfurase-like protein
LVRQELEEYNIIVGLGSSCKGFASNNMLMQLKTPEIFMKSVIRVSLGLRHYDKVETSEKDINRFIASLDIVL